MNFKFLFSKENRLTSALTIIYFIVGILFCILPSFMMDTLEVAVCFALLAYGSIVMFAYCISSAVLKNRKLIVSALLSIILGAFLLFVRAFFVFALACLVLSFAIIKTIALKKSNQSKNFHWYMCLVLSIIYFTVSLLIFVFFILNKFIVLSMMLIGVCFVLEAVANALILIKLSKQPETLNSQIDLDENPLEEQEENSEN